MDQDLEYPAECPAIARISRPYTDADRNAFGPFGEQWQRRFRSGRSDAPEYPKIPFCRQPKTIQIGDRLCKWKITRKKFLLSIM